MRITRFEPVNSNFHYPKLVPPTDNLKNLRIVGEGGEGTIYKINSHWVIKLFKMPDTYPAGIEREAAKTRISLYLNKIKDMPDLRKYGPVPVLLAYGVRNNVIGYVMPYEEVKYDLTTLIVKSFRAKTNIDLPQAVQTLKRVNDIFRELHELGIVIGDVKPGNIVINSNNEIRLLDLDGIAFGQYPTLGATEEYLDPISFETGKFSPKSDIFCLASMLLTMLTGATPYSGAYFSKDKELDYGDRLKRRLSIFNPKVSHVRFQKELKKLNRPLKQFFINTFEKKVRKPIPFHLVKVDKENLCPKCYASLINPYFCVTCNLPTSFVNGRKEIITATEVIKSSDYFLDADFMGEEPVILSCSDNSLSVGDLKIKNLPTSCYLGRITKNFLSFYIAGTLYLAKYDKEEVQVLEKLETRCFQYSLVEHDDKPHLIDMTGGLYRNYINGKIIPGHLDVGQNVEGFYTTKISFGDERGNVSISTRKIGNDDNPELNESKIETYINPNVYCLTSINYFTNASDFKLLIFECARNHVLYTLVSSNGKVINLNPLIEKMYVLLVDPDQSKYINFDGSTNHLHVIDKGSKIFIIFVLSKKVFILELSLISESKWHILDLDFSIAQVSVKNHKDPDKIVFLFHKSKTQGYYIWQANK